MFLLLSFEKEQNRAITLLGSGKNLISFLVIETCIFVYPELNLIYDSRFPDFFDFFSDFTDFSAIT